MDKHDFRIGKFYYSKTYYSGKLELGLIPYRCIGIDPNNNPVLRGMGGKFPFTLRKDFHLWIEDTEDQN